MKEPLTEPLESARLRLRPLAADDGPLLEALDADEAVIRYTEAGLTVGALRGAGALEGFLARARPPFGFRAAFLCDGGDFVGWFHMLREGDESANLGFRLCRQAWGRGLASEGAAALMAAACGAWGARRITATTLAENARARRVLERIGLRPARRFRHRSGRMAVAYACLCEPCSSSPPAVLTPNNE